jgi:hypothetical protein
MNARDDAWRHDGMTRMTRTSILWHHDAITRTSILT